MTVRTANMARRPFSLSWRAKTGVLLVVLYTFYAAAQLDFSWARFETGLGHAATFLARMFPPNFEKPDTLWKGIAESLEIAVLASVLGILLTLIAIIMLGEILAGFVRKVFLDNMGFERILQRRFTAARGLGSTTPLARKGEVDE
nr:hypothetical protein [Bordetella pertussis]